MLNRIKSAVIVGLLALTGIGVSAAPAHADQNAGYEYFDPHDQDVHGDQPKFGEFGYKVAPVGFTAAPATMISCPAAYLCTYEDYGFAGQMYYYTGPFNACITIGAPWTNMISSVINNKSIPVRLYYNICSSNLFNQNMGPNSDKYTLGAALDNHVKSMWIGFTPPH